MLLESTTILDMTQQVIAIITALAGLIGTGVSAFFAIKTLIKARKEKTLKENWEFIRTIALSAMSKAEESGKQGKEKKEMAIDAVKEACKVAGIDLDAFIDQLVAFIDQSIEFANTIK